MYIGLTIHIGSRYFKEDKNPPQDELQFWLPFNQLMTYGIMISMIFSLLWTGVILVAKTHLK